MIPSPVCSWLGKHDYGAVTATYPVGGGCINNGVRLATQSGQSFFLKTNNRCPIDMFAREAEGLTALAVPGGPRVPRAFVHGPNFLLLEDLNPAPRMSNYWQLLGHQLAALHMHTAPQFGFEYSNYIGSTPQINPFTEDGHVFFAQHRFIYQAELAGRRGLLSANEIQRVTNLANQLPDLIPVQPASMIHGDLWSGNMIADVNGAPAIIDPAAHYGWAEADLAMTGLFGSPPERFYQAYQEARPTPPGLVSRFPVYNLYHLLNHLNLFGRMYYGQVMSVVRQWG
jgi:protein-ribulosamine 3-kinase